MIVPVASVALLTATVGAAAATASSTTPAASPSASKPTGGTPQPSAPQPSKTPPSKGCGGGGGGGVTKTPPPPGIADAEAAQILAGIMHVSQSKAAQVLERLDEIARQDDGVTPTDPKFVALAQSLHLTAQQLSDDLVQMKQDLAKLMPSPSDSSKPAPSSGQS
jgi:hypothetical protein